MTLSQLEYALAVEEHLNFVRAAEACHIAQPSLSTQLKKLEERLGIQIFKRSTKSGVAVTEIGQIALDQARIILQESKKLEDLCANFTNEVSGILRVGVIPTIGPFLLSLFLKKLSTNYPQLQLEFFEDSTNVLIEELRMGRIDVAILSPQNRTPPHLIDKLLYYEPFVVYAAKDHPLLSHKEIKLATLSNYMVTLLDEAHCMHDQVMTACSSKSMQSPEISLKQGSLQTLISLVESQNSFTLIPKLSENVLNLKYRNFGLRPIVAPTPYRKVSLIFNKKLVRKKLIDALHETIQSCLPDSVSKKLYHRDLVIEPGKDHFKTNRV